MDIIDLNSGLTPDDLETIRLDSTGILHPDDLVDPGLPDALGTLFTIDVPEPTSNATACVQAGSDFDKVAGRA